MSGSSSGGNNDDSMFKYALLFLGKSVVPWYRRRVDQAKAVSSDINSGYPRVLGATVLLCSTLYFTLWYRALNDAAIPRAASLHSLHNDDNDTDNNIDVIVIGAGVVGSSTAYHLAQCSLRVVLVDKYIFPRDKLCGDVLTNRAQSILKEMGVLHNVLQQGCYSWINTRGVISPCGESIVGTIAGNRDITVQRVRLDDCVVSAAQQAGVIVMEGFNTDHISFKQGMWTVRDQEGESTLNAPMLVIADGSNSSVGRSLGIVNDAPSALAGRAFVETGTHNMKADSISVYASCLLPGHLSFTRLVDDHLIVQVVGLVNVDAATLHSLYHRVMQSEAVQTILGKDAVVSPLHIIPLRVNQVPKPYCSHAILVGDAAGQVDPLTGQGMQYGLEASQIAATTISECFAAEDLSENSLQNYQSRVSKLPWGFSASSVLARLIVRFPIFIDAALNVIKRRGSIYLSRWYEALSGDSLWFVQQAPLVMLEAFRLKILRLFVDKR